MSLDLVPAGPAHAEVLAAIHEICFADSWSAQSLADSLAMPGAAGLIAMAGGAPCEPAGIILWRAAAGEAEILTLAVLPSWRRHGVGRRLLAAALDRAAAAGAACMFLEVADGNAAAFALYRGAGFVPVGRRKGYYDGADALTMRRHL
ncbi:MAG: GNAT family N-acetyltransferase [Magnetospirillum sp.]|nr:GNAT family N-acetyltransferase [Magnetospirillum sp.]